MIFGFINEAKDEQTVDVNLTSFLKQLFDPNGEEQY